MGELVGPLVHQFQKEEELLVGPGPGRGPQPVSQVENVELKNNELNVTNRYVPVPVCIYMIMNLVCYLSFFLI